MKIVHIIHSLDPRSGGPSNALYALTQAQLKMGHSVSVIATDRQSTTPWLDDRTFQQIIKDKLPKDLATLTIIPSYGRKRPWVRYGWSPTCKPILIREFSRFHKDEDCFVHIHGLFSQITQVAASVSQQLRIPFTIRPTGALDPATIRKGATFLKQLFIRCWLKKTLASARFIQATSEMERQSLASLAWNPNVREIPLGVTIPEWRPKDFRNIFYQQFPTLQHTPFLLCLSRIHPIKRIDLAIQAFHHFQDQNTSYHLVIAGSETPHQQTLMDLADHLGVREKVHFIGFVEGDVKSSAYFSAHGFLQTSEHENFGQTVMEALAHGLPVVCTPGVATGLQVKESNGGFVTRDDSVEEISNALSRLIQSNPTGSQKRLSQWTEANFSWMVTAARLENVYRSNIN